MPSFSTGDGARGGEGEDDTTKLTDSEKMDKVMEALPVLTEGLTALQTGQVALD